MLISPKSLCVLLLVTVSAVLERPTFAQAPANQPQWIWAPQHQKDQVPDSSCYFRKSINIKQMTGGQIMIAADDEYELWINGKKIAEDNNWRNRKRYDISQYLKIGDNVFAVQVRNTNGNSAGLLAEITIFGSNNQKVSFPSNASWKTDLRPFPLWQSTFYSDSRWGGAQEFGPADSTSPWGTGKPHLASGPPVPPEPTFAEKSKPSQRPIEAKPISTKKQPDVIVSSAPEAAPEENPAPETSRFRILPGFAIQEVLSAEKTGALISMTFNEFGNIIASKEGGDLMLLYDTNDDGIVDSMRTYNDTVKNVQGILPLNGDVFVIGEGSEGTGLYRLSDTDQDGKVEEVATLAKFNGAIGEHGPHALALGPDGLIYMVAGNDTKLDFEISETSPHRHFYEGDLVPRFEDPGGHAVGVKAPGGMVLRTDIEGQNVEVVAGGIRNAYDLAFNRNGDLFIHDSDMEWDEGLVWHRPTRIYQVSPGADFGWRSGWAKWPDYYPDCVPPILETGAGSPTGVVVYDHFKYPAKYQNRLFVTDWANGRISTVELTKEGAGYTAKSEPLLEGKPMNVTDLEVGPDGWVYFTTGGRGTEGGLYRIVYKGEISEGAQNLGEGIAKAIRFPQPQSAWGRQKIAEIQAELGDSWNPQIQGVAIAEENPAYYRTRALDLMQLYGPTPTLEMLLDLTKDEHLEVCQKAAALLVNYPGAEATDRLKELLSHDSAAVRREACNSLAEIEAHVTFDELRPLLVAADRREAYAARRLLEMQPVDDWIDLALDADSAKLFNAGCVAALVAQPSRDRAIQIAQRAQKRLDDYLSDGEFLGMLRVIQLAVHRGDLQDADVPGLADRIANEFPAGDDRMNRELIRTLAHFHVSNITDRYIAHLDSDIPAAERLNLAMHMSFISEGWTSEQKLKLLGHLESGLKIDGGEGLRGYIETSTKQFVKCLTPQEQYVALSMGHMWPNAALAVLFELPEHPSEQVLATLRMIDKELVGNETTVATRMRKGIVAILAGNGTPENMAYLREAFEREPERRASIAFGLAQQPEGMNFPYLVKAIPVLEGDFATNILQKLNGVAQNEDDPQAIRQLILLGLRLDDSGKQAVSQLLAKWTGESAALPSDSPEKQIVAWQQWFTQSHPDLPEAKLVDAKSSNWNLDELLDFLTSEDYHGGDAASGALIFKKAQCAACHRMGSVGEAIGPDLTDISHRFQKKQILESVLFPSHVISDQYVTKQILTLDGKVLSGLVSTSPSGAYVVIDSQGNKTEVPKVDVDEMTPSKVSVMPSGLLDQLTAEEIGDLMTYLKANKQDQKSRIAERPTGSMAR
ncbi:HEAT repeat domain-containing protein [Blastopirellula marina]|uniref:Heme-binding protein n=1 Tax=Blastopirellula marina TaxID=124 RepID=A0A2S8FHH5_9BACT|nr:HEAT repeat domain-containing protein [Blastopirellula marina]PQO31617.1 heme-binding protein [Blastopirellula marina]PTL42924.1 heme-binding protein [Blastopirellula marina]